MQVTSGFARESGLDQHLSKKWAGTSRHVFTDVAAIGQRKAFNSTDGSTKFISGARPDGFSRVLNWGVPEEHKSTRMGRVNTGVASADQRHITRGHVKLTSAEIRFLEKRRLGVAYNNPDENTSSREKNRFNSDVNQEIDWSQVGVYYEIIPNSVVDKAAYKVGARLEAGISGSTGLMLDAATFLNMNRTDMQRLRLGLAGL